MTDLSRSVAIQRPIPAMEKGANSANGSRLGLDGTSLKHFKNKIGKTRFYGKENEHSLCYRRLF